MTDELKGEVHSHFIGRNLWNTYLDSNTVCPPARENVANGLRTLLMSV